MEDWQIALVVILTPVVIVLFVFAMVKLKERVNRDVEYFTGAVTTLVADYPDESQELFTQVMAHYGSAEYVQHYTWRLEQLRKVNEGASKATGISQKYRKLQRLSDEYQQARRSTTRDKKTLTFIYQTARKEVLDE